MRVFLTGATGFIGSHVIPELLASGHQVLGLTRSDAGARELEAAGVDVHRGDLDQPETLASGVAAADAVIHCAFDHNFETFFENTKKDARNIAAMGEALAGTHKPLLITSGVGIGTPLGGGPATEDVLNPRHANPRIATELAGAALIARCIDVRTIRLPQVHDTTRAGLITPLVAEARRAGAVAYLGAGQTRWSAAHVGDVAKLYVLALERGEPGARYHASVEEGVAARAVAEAVGKGTGLPVRSVAADEVERYFGWMAPFAALDMTASNAWTRARLGWEPTGPGLLTDLAAWTIRRPRADRSRRVVRRIDEPRETDSAASGRSLAACRGDHAVGPRRQSGGAEIVRRDVGILSAGVPEAIGGSKKALIAASLHPFETLCQVSRIWTGIRARRSFSRTLSVYSVERHNDGSRSNSALSRR